jgi:hypothetical protein
MKKDVRGRQKNLGREQIHCVKSLLYVFIFIVTEKGNEAVLHLL